MRVPRYDGNEIIKTEDQQDEQLLMATNFDLLMRILGSTQIVTGLVGTESPSPGMSVVVSGGSAWDDSLKEYLFSEDGDSLNIDTADPVSLRKDIIQARRIIIDYDSASRDFKDPSSGIITPSVINTKQQYTIEFFVKKGSPGGDAPAVDSGYIKLMEVWVPASTSAIYDSNIKNADAGKSGESNTDWTTDTNNIFRSGSWSDIKQKVNDLYVEYSGYTVSQFLRSDADDSALGIITFLSGIILDSIISQPGNNLELKTAFGTQVRLKNSGGVEVNDNLDISGNLSLDNNKKIQMENLAATDVSSISVDSSDILNIQTVGGGVKIKNDSGNKIATFSESGDLSIHGDVYIKDQFNVLTLLKRVVAESWKNTTISDGDMSGVCFSESLGLFVAVGSAASSNVAYSSDGVNWTSITISDGDLVSVCFSESLGLFVAVGYGATNNVAYSSNGISWTSITISDGNLASVCFSESLGLFVAVGLGPANNVAYSSNGISWTSITIPNGDLHGVCFSEPLGLFVAVGNILSTNNLAYSSDGVNWTSITVPNGNYLNICFSNSVGRFVGVGSASTNNIIYSL